MIENIRTLGIRDGFVAWRRQVAEQNRLAEFDQHTEPNSANFFWLIRYIKKHKLEQEYADQGYIFSARYRKARWTSTDQTVSGTSDAVRLKLTHPSPDARLGLSTVFDWDDMGSKDVIHCYTCAVDLTKPADKGRIGDLSVDVIQKAARGSQELSIVHRYLDGNDDSFGLSIGVLTPTFDILPAVFAKSYRIMHAFLRDGQLPPQLDMPALT